MYVNAVKHDKNMTHNTKLMLLVNDFEEVDYFLKKLVSSMKKVSISSISLFSNLKYGSSNFLTDDQGSNNESDILLVNLKENKESLRLVVEILKKRQEINLNATAGFGANKSGIPTGGASTVVAGGGGNT